MIHLTGQNFTSKEIIQHVFSPLIGSICSPLAEEICQKNNLTFSEMLQPFTRLTTDEMLRDSNGSVTSMKGMRLNVCDVNWRPPQTTLARKMLSDAVTTCQCERTKSVKIEPKAFLDIPTVEPWYELWRETFFTVQFPADHEFTRHFLSCMIVLSSVDVNALDMANQLTRKVQMMQNVTPPKLPKWFSVDTLNSYVMLHDSCQGDITRAQQAFETLKLTFGEHRCFLLQINSQPTTSNDCTDPWIRYLKRHPKSDGHSDQSSAPRTPQDISGVTTIPTSIQISAMETPPSELYVGSQEIMVDHPLSPTMDQGGIGSINSNLSTSCDSLTSQPMNPNVWGSEPVDIDVPHGMWLSSGDLDNLKHFIQDYTKRSLIPHVEKLVTNLNDTITNKKGVSRSLISATKRWFVTNKPGVNTTQNAVVYMNDSTELQTRKLGDLYFMFGSYASAFQAYHQAKRDFNLDSAWQYYAGALEMAALSAFMQGTANRKTYDYMEEAISIYLNICRMPQFATRATILSVECLRSAKLFAESAKQLIRMTSEDSDLRSALLLEQSSYSFLMCQPTPQYRKYAFHIVLAGHRFSKAGQRKHAFRCYKQAYQVFEDRGWSLAEDHIQYTIGKHACTLKRLDEASAALAHLLRPLSLQGAQQQGQFLREYIATQKTLLTQSGNVDLLLDIALPKIMPKAIRVLVTSHSPVSTPNSIAATNININANLAEEWKWQKLEETVLQFASQKPVMIFKPVRSLFTSDDTTADSLLCIVGEPIEISFVLENTIKPSITFEDINLLWTFVMDNGDSISNSNIFKTNCAPEERTRIHSLVASTFVKTLLLNEHENKQVIIKLIPHQMGHLKISGVIGRLSATNETSSLWGKINFVYDNKLDLVVMPSVPSLYVSFSPIPPVILAGEIIPVNVTLTNSGMYPIEGVYLATETPRLILVNDSKQELPLSILKDLKDLKNETLSRDKEARKQQAYRLLETNIESNYSLNPQESKTQILWIQAPFTSGQFDVKLLFYYNTPIDYPKIRYRLVRHVWNLNVNDSLSFEATCNIGNLITNELGIDCVAKNLNQVHHLIASEIFLRDIHLYCSDYRLNKDRVVYYQSPCLERIESSPDSGLRPLESLSFRCPLNELKVKTTFNQIDFITNRLTTFKILTDENCSSHIPNIQSCQSFLIKHETKFITGTNEEFHSIITTNDPHMTLTLTWKAVINENSSMKRLAYGQHFVQLRYLYESVYCPMVDVHPLTIFSGNHNRISIFDFKSKIGTDQWPFKNEQSYGDAEDDWENNEISVGHRCLLEVESGSLSDCNQQIVQSMIEAN